MSDGKLTGYNTLDIQDVKVLDQWRWGHSAANPGEAQALVAEIDRLRGVVRRSYDMSKLFLSSAPCDFPLCGPACTKRCT